MYPENPTELILPHRDREEDPRYGHQTSTCRRGSIRHLRRNVQHHHPGGHQRFCQMWRRLWRSCSICVCPLWSTRQLTLLTYLVSLLRAKATFITDGYNSPADYDESMCRAVACEVLARRIVHNLPTDRLESVMSHRFRYRENDGDVSPASSALETAIDHHCTVSSSMVVLSILPSLIPI